MSQTDNSLPRWNTTCTLWHGPVMEGPALLNGATAPDLIGIPCRLEPAMAAQPTVTGELRRSGCPHNHCANFHLKAP